MMGVTSTTKMKMYTTVALGLVAALSVSPTWASTTPGSIPTTVTANLSNVVSTQSQSNSDLSVLRSKLKDRFSGVATEVTSLINGTTSPADSFRGSSALRTLDVRQGIGVKPANVSSQDVFVDIENDPYETYINRLAAYGVLTPSQKFYPQNYFRVNDFIKLLSKLYYKKFNQTLVSQDILGMTSSDGIITKGMFQQINSLLKSVKLVSLDGNSSDKLIRSEGAYYLVRIFDLPALAIDTQVSASQSDGFTDIDNHLFAPAITTLASLGIFSTETPKFYPDNYLRHYDFTIIFVNALLASKNQSLPLNSSTSQFADVEAAASYLSQLNYAADHGLIDDLITSKRGQLFFDPNSFITKHAVYQILSKIVDIQFIYDETKADSEKISRAELAKLLVDSFEFTPQTIQSDLSSGTIFTPEDLTLVTKLKTLLSIM